MRVLYSFPHRVGRSGIGTIAEHQIRGLIDRGHDVSLYCMSQGAVIPGLRRQVTTMALGRYRIPRRSIGFERAIAYHDWRVARVLGARAGEFDAVHCWGFAGVRTLEMARQVGVHSFREVPNAHTALAYERSEEEASRLGVRMPRGHSHINNPRKLAREEHEFELADTLLVPSDFVLQTFVDRGFTAAQLVRHRYGFDPDRFPRPSPRMATDNAPITACFVGQGEPRKGLHYALQAWLASGLASSGRFVICGALIRDYERKLGVLLAHPSVDVVGFRADVADVMRRADMLVLPSVEEGSALVTYEAQASGCALVVSDATGAFCPVGAALVHPAGDVAALTDHLRLLDTDRDLLIRLQEWGVSRRPELTWDAAALTLDEIYRTRGATAGNRLGRKP